jgi:hypothetical protein
MRVLVFFPHNPFPPRSGAHRRCIEMLAGMRELGHTVTLASSEYTTETKWHTISETAYAVAGSPILKIHSPTRADWRYNHYWHLAQRYFPRRVPLSSIQYVLPSMPRWFAQLAQSFQPDRIWMNYAFYDRVVSPRLHAHTHTVIEMLDFVTLYQPRFDALRDALPPPPLAPERVNPALLDETFLDALDVSVAPEEYRIYDKYRHTIAITAQDAARLRQHAPRTRVTVIPMTYAIPSLQNTYDGPALFTTGPNPFNVQGYLYFAAHVLPRIRARVPNFQLLVTGRVASLVEPTENIILRDFVPDLAPQFASARFLVCPILAKTGQLVKIPEAMAHGLPVVATARAAEGSPICHGENGFVAHNAQEFAEYVMALWQDRALCRRMGDAARATIAQNFSRAHLLNHLARVLQ